MDFPTMARAILNISPNSSFTMLGDDYSSIQWLDTNINKPTREEVESEFTRLKEAYSAAEYQRLRKSEYPPIEDQLDDIFHLGIEGWKQKIQDIKDKYPK